MNRVQSEWAILLAAAAATAALAEPVRRALIKGGRLDVPNHRSSHTTPVPRGGGIATVLGAVTASLVCRAYPDPRATAGVVGLAALGLADDITGHVPARVRLAGQLAAGSSLFAQDRRDAVVTAPVTAGIVNVVNFMDGINGISGMTAVAWGINAMLLEDDRGGHLATLGALTAGAGLGFLPHNVPSARLFLGDVGSYAFGAAMAAGILSQTTLRRRYQVGAPLILYACDATQALVRRAITGKPLSEAHREHIYQQLVDQGQSHMRVALLHATGAALVSIASRSPGPAACSASIAVCATYLLSPHIGRNFQRLKGRRLGTQ